MYLFGRQTYCTSNSIFLDRNVCAKFESQSTAYNAQLKITKLVSAQCADAQSNIVLQSVAEVALNGIGWKWKLYRMCSLLVTNPFRRSHKHILRIYHGGMWRITQSLPGCRRLLGK